ncbi:MAG: hypothetical protein ORO03_09095, partial [Alphaproteobacteria bacterium]|nr:hypothetical protein [Alphaproteobacteria bacterium]
MSAHESTINVAIAELLKTTRRRWEPEGVVNAEQNGLVEGNATRPDILVIEGGVSPVVVENEIMPNIGTVDDETRNRMGQKLRGNKPIIQSAIALVTPERFRNFSGERLRQELRLAEDLEMALYTGTRPEVIERWPEAGYLSGSIDDLSLLVQAATVPPAVVEAAANQLEQSIAAAASMIKQMNKDYPGLIERIGVELHQELNEQTMRMAAAILLNAFIFHETLAGGEGALKNIRPYNDLIKRKDHAFFTLVLDEWESILKINYWPIFDIAHRILSNIPTKLSQELVAYLVNSAQSLLSINLMRSHDLTGAAFQKLISDRKFLAAFYTTPASASLLVGLALDPTKPPGGGDWAKPKDLTKLRIADFSCGTGTLLSTTYQRLGQIHELHGGNPEKLHPAIMAKVLIGCDILPAAAHLTASMLAGTYPNVTYERSAIYTVPYGQTDGEQVSLGSIDLIDPERQITDTLNLNAVALDSKGETKTSAWEEFPHKSVDLVIMNPPFTRSTNHEGNHREVHSPMFAAFGASPQLQKLMSAKTAKLINKTSAHGNAGEASIFFVLGDRKLKVGGTMALVMPISLVTGNSWENTRKALAENYDNLIIITIAGGGSHDMSFSADTGMGECLIIARKRFESCTNIDKIVNPRAIFVVLNRRPANNLVGIHAAKQIRFEINNSMIKKLEDGPEGGTPIKFGKDIIGHMIDAPLPKSWGWNLARIVDLSLAQTAYQITHRMNLWLPGIRRSATKSIMITEINSIASLGPIHRDINGIESNGKVRGPFDLIPLKPNQAPTYPILWAHDAQRERTLKFKPDHQGYPRTGKTEKEREFISDKVENIWDTASHCHFNKDFQFNSQSTAMQFTPKPAIGGTAWHSVKLESPDLEKALVLWSNTSLGLLLYWWHSNKQQSGRGRIAKTALGKLPVLDVTKLTAVQLAAAVRLFDDFCETPLAPMHRLDEDGNRITLDERFCAEVLGLPAAVNPH